MKEQYVGDENDYRKYALLRHFGAAGARVGICWMLTPPDGGPDGGKTAYLDLPDRWRTHDPELFDQLRGVRSSPGARRLNLIERRGVIPEALFFAEHLSDRVDLRRAFFAAAFAELRRADLIFFNPDNGLDVKSIRPGHLGSSKYLYRAEVAEAYGRGHSVLVYQHFPRLKREQFIAELGADLPTHAPNARIWCYRTAQVAFLLLINPRHATVLGRAAAAAAARWPREFLAGRPLEVVGS
jgi:hypothetical protein